MLFPWPRMMVIEVSPLMLFHGWVELGSLVPACFAWSRFFCTSCLFRLLCCDTLVQAPPAAPLFLLRHACTGFFYCATLVKALPAAVIGLLARPQSESEQFASMLRLAITKPLALSLLRSTITKSLVLSFAAVVGLLARAQHVLRF